ncbi:cytochrome oxidase putative small subunit CydP [Thiobacillus denitrificans]|jgi:hypothetical protein|uniref:cytochrome oxidase putative small subunit CydP n=1 Tax=Thiobacillus denitrificans TaxID=36861 RepID=UPI000380D23D|nr:cytochrome oxidase putative small subunit CydP [Thiobacillus denitrificans]
MKLILPVFLHHPLAREISLALVIKLLVIAAIFYAFFAGHTPNPDADAVAERIASPHPPTQTQPSLGSSHAD